MSSTDGFVAIPKHILQNSELNPESIVLYAHLLHYDRGPKGLGCIAKRSTLSKMSGLSLHKLRKAILNLEENGIISVIRRRNSLTDRIRINPDCRPKLSTPRRSGTSSAKAKSKTRTRQEVKKVNSYSLKSNKNTQDNKISCQNNSNSLVVEEKVTETPKIIPKTPPQRSNGIKPHPKHIEATKSLLRLLEGALRPQSYLYWFKDKIEVSYTDNKSVNIKCNNHAHTDWIKFHYSDLISKITNKEVSFCTDDYDGESFN